MIQTKKSIILFFPQSKGDYLQESHDLQLELIILLNKHLFSAYYKE